MKIIYCDMVADLFHYGHGEPGNQYQQRKNNNMKSTNCPKYSSCSSAFCPVSMEGIHLKDEAICHYYREIHNGLIVPEEVYQTIKSNEPSFLSSNSVYGCMSEYRSISKSTLQTA